MVCKLYDSKLAHVYDLSASMCVKTSIAFEVATLQNYMSALPCAM